MGTVEDFIKKAEAEEGREFSLEQKYYISAGWGGCLNANKEPASEIPCSDRAMPVVDGKIEIIYKHNKPYGIRDAGGFLFFFTDVNKYMGQEERYRQEIEQQFRLADYLLDALKKA